MSEREELEGPASRKDPLKTSENASLAIGFGLLGIVIMLWPVWLVVIVVVGLAVFLVLFFLISVLESLIRSKAQGVTPFWCWVFWILVGLILLAVGAVVCLLIFLLVRNQKKRSQKMASIDPEARNEKESSE